ncbi:MAG: hypothetical protein LBG88_00915 [Christensenellaceae bacterium]|jgi:hypothetical protein|nr:hypothetical protein [Christensenellaceae bacterium]
MSDSIKITSGDVLIPVMAGAIVNLAGGDIGTAALVCAGVASAKPLVDTAVAVVAGGTIFGKKTALMAMGAGLIITALSSGFGAGFGAVGHTLTDVLKDNVKPKAAVEINVDAVK